MLAFALLRESGRRETLTDTNTRWFIRIPALGMCGK